MCSENTPSSSCSYQSRIKNYIDRCDSREKALLDQSLARTVFSAALPFSLVENKHFTSFLKLAKPSYQPPTRRALAGTLLDKEYFLVQKCVKN